MDVVRCPINPRLQTVTLHAVRYQTPTILKCRRGHNRQVITSIQLAAAVFRAGNVDVIIDLNSRCHFAATISQLSIELQRPIIPIARWFIQNSRVFGLLVERSLVIEVHLKAGLLPAFGFGKSSEILQNVDVLPSVGRLFSLCSEIKM